MESATSPVFDPHSRIVRKKESPLQVAEYGIGGVLMGIFALLLLFFLLNYFNILRVWQIAPSLSKLPHQQFINTGQSSLFVPPSDLQKTFENKTLSNWTGVIKARILGRSGTLLTLAPLLTDKDFNALTITLGSTAIELIPKNTPGAERVIQTKDITQITPQEVIGGSVLISQNNNQWVIASDRLYLDDQAKVPLSTSLPQVKGNALYQADQFINSEVFVGLYATVQGKVVGKTDDSVIIENNNDRLTISVIEKGGRTRFVYKDRSIKKLPHLSDLTAGMEIKGTVTVVTAGESGQNLRQEAVTLKTGSAIGNFLTVGG